jgi:hypothetical protein
MKINKWTLGLAAVGLVSLAPALLAQSVAQQQTPLLTSLSATTISGYVDTSAVWNPGTGNANPAPYAFNSGKQDGFNLDAVDIKLSKAIEEGKWSAGYVAELSWGPDAQAIDSGAYPIRQAYVDLGIPVGNGLELKVGRWDALLGYESSDAMNNPNWSRSYGKTFEPTEETGILAAYKFADWIGLQAGVSDTLTTSGGVNARSLPGTYGNEGKKAFTSLITLTAPDSWGFLKGSALYGGFAIGQGAASASTEEFYLGATMNTPITGLTLGAAYDEFQDVALSSGSLAGSTIGPKTIPGGFDAGYFESIAGYMSYKVNDKASLNGRIEYAQGSALKSLDFVTDGSVTPSGTFGVPGTAAGPHMDKVLAFTGTFEYDLWANVISRIEVRWDKNAGGGGDAFGGIGSANSGIKPTANNEVMIAANVIYKF